MKFELIVTEGEHKIVLTTETESEKMVMKAMREWECAEIYPSYLDNRSSYGPKAEITAMTLRFVPKKYETIPLEYILVELKEKLDSCSPISMKELAANIDITPKKLKAILEGEKEPCDKVLAYLSIDKVVGYRRRR